MPLPTESNLIGEDPSTGLALDDLYKEYETGDGAKPVTEEKPVVEEKPVTEEKPAVEEKPVVEEKPATEEKPVVEEKPDDGLPPEEPLKRTPATEEVVPPAEEVDPALKAFDDVKLRPDASQKTRDSFAKLKEISTAALRTANAEKLKLRQDFETERADLLKKAAAPATAVAPDVQKELEELRGFKATFDIENDPTFKKDIEAKMEIPKAANYEAIYTILQSFKLPESEVKALKEMSESDRVSNIAELIEKIPRVSKMQVEAKLLANLNLDDARAKAISDARAAAASKKAEFREAPEKVREKELAEVKTQSDKFRSYPVFKKHEITAATPAEEKKRFEAENTRIDSLAKLYDEAVNDPTPAGRAENAFGVVLAYQFKHLADTANAKVVKLEAELAAIKKRGGLGNLGKVVNVDPNKRTSRPAAESEQDAGSSLDDLAKAAGFET